MRIAIREEGTFLNAYIAQPGSLEKAILLASMRVAVARMDPSILERWKVLLTEMFNATLKDTFGVEAEEFVEQSAPPGERSGSA